MVSKDSDRFKFNKNGTDFLTGSYIGYSSGSNDLNILDSKIELNISSTSAILISDKERSRYNGCK